MSKSSTVDILKHRGVTERDISIWTLHTKGGKGSTFKELAVQFDVNPVTISRRVKKVQKMLHELEVGVKAGEVTLQTDGLASQSKAIVQQGSAQTSKLALPDTNPFLALETFGELAGISSAGGSVIGMGAATLVQGFTREDLPYEQRQNMAMKGASVLAGGLLAAYLTFVKFSEQTGQQEQQG